MRGEIVHRELEHFGHLIQFDLAARERGRVKRRLVVVAQKMLVALAIGARG